MEGMLLARCAVKALATLNLMQKKHTACPTITVHSALEVLTPPSGSQGWHVTGASVLNLSLSSPLGIVQ